MCKTKILNIDILQNRKAVTDINRKALYLFLLVRIIFKL